MPCCQNSRLWEETKPMPQPVTEALKQAPTRDRSEVKRGFSGLVVPDEGDRGQGVIREFSVITRGEALGHGMWCDAVFIQQVSDALAAAGDAGIKSRFTHPNLSADGLAQFLGNCKAPLVDGDQCLADLHFSKSAHETPEGDLAAYLMTMAQDDPDKFGSSIVFVHDMKAEELFYIEHKDEAGNFQSPDPDNVKNLPHVRLKELKAVDIVDDPAANPGGLFHRGQEVAQEATSLMEYALELDGSTPPAVGQFDIDPDRLKSFFTRFLADKGLEITPRKETEAMTKETSTPADNAPQEAPQGTPAPAAPAAPTRSDFAADLKRFTDAFGGENGAAWFSEEITFEEALGRQVDLLTTELNASQEKVQELEAQLAAIDTGEPEPFESTPSDKAGEKKTFQSLVKIRK